VTLDAVLVTGEHEGPRMWKVSKGEHTLWILGVYGPLPQKMKWRSQAVEDVIKDSQEVISAPAVQINPSWIRGVFLLPKYYSIQKNPNHASLSTVVPTDTYVRFAALKAKYAPRDKSIESLAPGFAALKLYGNSVTDTGLTFDTKLWSTVTTLAKKHSVPVTVVWVKGNDLSPWMDQVRDIPPSAHNECLNSTLTRIESDMTALRARANAWATGDIKAFRFLPYEENGNKCQDLWLNHTPIGIALMQQTMPRWFEAVDEALAKNRSTFTVFAMTRLLQPDGPLAALRAKGYSVEEPLGAAP
jgi:uncharacterized protein YbaP (TraB family)